ncbi:MAG: sigma-70 family RNA polymerase sigma factor [Planctomycetes bacterium]|nr:sigma-70 family RNA polymerase sigma factor [Planctomycetota bacterium]
MPASHPEPSVTLLLRALERGEAGAGEELMRTVFGELRALARARLRKLPAGQTLQPTALVHEAYLRLVEKDGQSFEGRKHFLFAAARAMHDVLVEEARRKASQKRGGAWRRAGPEALTVAVEAPAEDLLALEDALAKLEARHPEQARLVHLRFYVGLSGAEIAEVLGVSERTVQREWRLARAKLFAELSETGAEDDA